MDLVPLLFPTKFSITLQVEFSRFSLIGRPSKTAKWQVFLGMSSSDSSDQAFQSVPVTAALYQAVNDDEFW